MKFVELKKVIKASENVGFQKRWIAINMNECLHALVNIESPILDEFDDYEVESINSNLMFDVSFNTGRLFCLEVCLKENAK